MKSIRRSSTTIRRVVVASVLMMTVFFAGLFLVTRLAIAWAKDLSSRIDIQVDGQDLAKAVNESMHYMLRGDDPAAQLQAIDCFTLGATESPEAAQWVRAEFYEDIVPLRDSTNVEVASKAGELLGLIETTPPTAAETKPE